MSSKYDLVVVGSGHNGLTTAAYLAKAGKKVLVLERNEFPGGGVATRELTVPGFRHDLHSKLHMMIQGNPMIRRDELGLLSKYGLQYVYPEDSSAICGTVFDDGKVLLIHRDIEKTCESIATVSSRDAEAYRRFAKMAVKLLPLISASLYTPPPPVGTTIAFLDQSQEGRELFRMMLMSGKDVVDEWFENDYVKIHLLKFLSENLHRPDENGTGIGVLTFLAVCHTWGAGRPVGGSGKLSEALVACIKDHGGEVIFQKEVTGFDIRSGRVMGVVTADGERYAANDAVVGSIHPHLLRNFFPDIDAGVLERAERVILSPYSIFCLHAAMNEPIEWRAGSEIKKAFFIEACRSNITDFYKSFDALKYGEIANPIQGMCIQEPSHEDPVRAPAGKSTLYISIHVPYKLQNQQNWDAIKERVGDEIIDNARAWISNITRENIIARRVESPLDAERYSPSFQKGDAHGIGAYFYQLSGYRPTPDLAQYKVPGIDGFYLVGPFMHPGGGVFGAGRGTAMKMLKDMGIDFNKIFGA